MQIAKWRNGLSLKTNYPHMGEMQMYAYKCVQIPELIKIGKKDAHSIAVQEYENLVNKYAKEGWEYVSVDAIESFFQQGCFKSLMASIPIIGAFFRTDELFKLKMIVFRKPL